MNKKLLIGVLVVSLIITPVSSVFAEAVPLSLQPDQGTSSDNGLAQAIQTKIQRSAFFLLGIQDKINSSKDELSLLKNNKKALELKIEESNVHIESLKSQLDNLTRLISGNALKIKAATLLGAQFENQIASLKDDVVLQQGALNDEIKSLDSAITAYYYQDNAFFDAANNQPRLLAFLATDQSTGDIVRANEYLFALQSTAQELAKSIITDQLNLDEKQNQLSDKEKMLAQLRIMLDEEKRNLLAAQESQNRLLDETKGKQVIYETLLSLSLKEESQVSLQVQRLKENFDFFQSKLDELNKNPQAFDISLLDGTSTTGMNALKGNAELAWPVPPTMGISALFHDSEYKKAMGVAHNAIDIRAPQGSPVHSAGDGVISKVSDNGYAYSYVIIAHPDNILTLYGHLSEIDVQEGQIVKQGQIIGLSGGMPGSKGAGWLTTGPHLHFEVFKNWSHVDPMDFLPLEVVPISMLPEKYLGKLMGTGDAGVKRK